MNTDPSYTDVIAGLDTAQWRTAREVAEGIDAKLSLVKRRLTDLVSGSRVDWSADPQVTGQRQRVIAYRLRVRA